MLTEQIITKATPKHGTVKGTLNVLNGLFFYIQNYNLKTF